MPHATASSVATSTCSAVADRQLKEAPAHLAEEHGIAGRQETVRAFAVSGVLDALALERLRCLAGGLLRREHERHPTSEHALQDRADERVVRAAQDHRVHVRLLQMRRVLAHRVGDLLAERLVALDQRDEPGTRDRHDLGACIERVHEVRVAPACDGGLGREEPYPPVARREHRCVRLGREHADDRDGDLPLEVGQRRGGGGVARGDDQLHALPLEVPRDLGREAPDLVERPRAVRKPGAVTEVDEVLVWKRDEALVQDGQSAHARVEDADGAAIHARGV